MRVHALNHIAFAVRDVARTCPFYEPVLGWNRRRTLPAHGRCMSEPISRRCQPDSSGRSRGLNIPRGRADITIVSGGPAKGETQDRSTGAIGDLHPPSFPRGRGEGTIAVKVLKRASDMVNHVPLKRQVNSCLITDDLYV